jgi:hypothetical protein
LDVAAYLLGQGVEWAGRLRRNGTTFLVFAVRVALVAATVQERG